MAKRLAGFNHRRVAKKLRAFGFEFKRQAGGSHEFWQRDADGRSTILPNHPGDMNPNVLQGILGDCGIGVDDFLAAK